jgi:hypothetical protein
MDAEHNITKKINIVYNTGVYRLNTEHNQTRKMMSKPYLARERIRRRLLVKIRRTQTLVQVLFYRSN